jgi:hypothetical protein
MATARDARHTGASAGSSNAETVETLVADIRAAENIYINNNNML